MAAVASYPGQPAGQTTRIGGPGSRFGSCPFRADPLTGASLIVLLSTSDTDLLSARASGADYRLANPARLAVEDLPALLDGATAVVVCMLGGRQAWEDGLDAVAATGLPMIVLGGEVTPDAELMQLSTVAGGVVAEAHAYLAHGGPENLLQLARFLSDAIALPAIRAPRSGR
jgi:cobaltochelatase CobN